MYSQGKVGLCYELGCKSDPRSSIALGIGVVRRFLQQIELSDSDPLPPLYENPDYIKTVTALIRRTENDDDFQMMGDFYNFQVLDGPTDIARDGTTIYNGTADDTIIFPPYGGKLVEPMEEICTLGRRVASFEALLTA